MELISKDELLKTRDNAIKKQNSKNNILKKSLVPVFKEAKDTLINATKQRILNNINNFRLRVKILDDESLHQNKIMVD